jgi:aminomethyltransferase
MTMKKTALHDHHKKHDAKMVDFFGWDMPVEYSGIVKEHMAVRQNAGLFDVSHMGEILIQGPDALDYVQYLTPNNAAKLDQERAQYSAMTTPQGTFVDDLLVYCLDEKTYLLVVNAANTDKDFDWVQSHKSKFDVKIENLSDEYTQLALQGPSAKQILTPLTEIQLNEMKPFRVRHGQVAGIDCMVSRTGYTGEDGFEIYTRSREPGTMWDALMDAGKSEGLLPIGLGARDTLRLEATLMLYGNDIDETTTVLEAGLGWLVKLKNGDFIGKAALEKQKEEGIDRKLSGFEVMGRGIARPHYSVFAEGVKTSEVRSGTYAPYLKKSIGLTYLPVDYAEPGKEIEIEIRGKRTKAQIVPLPFYKRK